MTQQNLLSEQQIAEKLGISPRTVRDWRARRIVPFYKVRSIVRYDLEKVMQALEAFERKALA